MVPLHAGANFHLWPLLFAFVAFLVGYLRLKVLPTALLVFGSVFVASLTYSILATSTNQAFAYFDTRTRLWEFAAGTLLAMLVLAWRVPSWLKVPLGWVGVIGLVTCGWLLPVEQAFPGYLALWPLLSGAFVIAAGQTGSRFGVDCILSAQPLQKMGAISYCLYLVHWPVLILYTTAVGKPQAGWLDGTLIIAGSIGLAWLLHNGVEKPLRAWEKKPNRRVLRYAASPAAPTLWAHTGKIADTSWVRPATILTVCLLLMSSLVLGGQRWLDAQTARWAANEQLVGTDRFPGALAAGTDSSYADTPVPMTTTNQRQSLDGSCQAHPGITNPALDDGASDNYCWVTLNSGADAPLTVVVGDSHAHHTALPLFAAIAEQTNTNVMAMLRPGCRFTTLALTEDPNDSCHRHNLEVQQQLLELRPDTVVVISTWTNPRTTQEDATPGLDQTLAELTAAGINVVGVRDNPRWEVDMFECAQNNLRDSSTCGAPQAVKMGASDEGIPVLGRYEGTYSLDFTPLLCPNGYCEAIIGNVIVYMDDNHLNKSFVDTMVTGAVSQLTEQGWNPYNPAVHTSLPVTE